MIFKLTNARCQDLGEVIVSKIEDLKKLQYGNEHNPKHDELIVDFYNMVIMIYNDWIE